MNLFRSSEERHAFIEELQRNLVTIEGRYDIVVGQIDAMISKLDRKVIAFSRAVIERFSEWRARESKTVDS